MEMFGYKCTLQTDTEVITYILDYLLRRQNLTLGEAASVIAAPFWSTIAAKNRSCRSEKAHLLTNSVPQPSDHRTFPPLFSVSNGGLRALNDRAEAPLHGRRRKKRYGLYCQ